MVKSLVAVALLAMTCHGAFAATPMYTTYTDRSQFIAAHPDVTSNSFVFPPNPDPNAVVSEKLSPYRYKNVTFSASVTGNPEPVFLYNDNGYGNNTPYLGTQNFYTGGIVVDALTISTQKSIIGLTLGILGQVNHSDFISYQVNNSPYLGSILIPETSNPSLSQTVFLGIDTGPSKSPVSVKFFGLAQELDVTGFDTAVPEPGTWLMMVLGVGLVGAAIRRKGHDRRPALA